jgi:hypothetical protein
MVRTTPRTEANSAAEASAETSQGGKCTTEEGNAAASQEDTGNE